MMRITRGTAVLGAVFSVVAVSGGTATAQCTTQWQHATGLPGTNGEIRATLLWDPDGSGPLAPVLVIGGWFTLAGNTPANNIAMQDPVSGTWSSLGAGLDFAASALAVLPNGDLAVGGEFGTAGGQPASHVASWNGASWSPLGAGITGLPTGSFVRKLVTMPNGDLVAGGFFTTAGGVPANNIARWNGSSWSALGSGLSGGSSVIGALAALPNGDLVAGGSFTIAGGGTANNIARWNGTSWSALGAGMNGRVDALMLLPNGDLVAGGDFTTAGSAPAIDVARWNGTSWSGFGNGIASFGNVRSLAMLGNGDLVAGGTFSTASGVPARNIARWDGATWVGLGAGVTGPYQYVLALTLLPNGDLSVAGVFTTAGTGPAANLARWTGSSWLPPSGGVAVMPAVVLAAAALPNGQAAVGGSESPSGWAAPNYVARWDGTAWSAINTGMLGVYSTPVVLAMTTLPNGDLWAGGRFTTAGFFANGLARWSGSSWQPVGLGVQGIATAFATLPNGDLAVGGNFQTLGSNPVFGIARWNGTTWSQLALVGGAYEIRAMLAHPNGDLTVSGVINPGPFGTPLILRWVGTTWLPLGTWTDALVDAAALVSMPNGDIVAGGSFLGAGGTPANYIARWNGATWSALGTGMNGPVLSLAVLPNGDLMAGGDFTTAGGLAARGVARWNGSAWSAPSSGPGVVGRVRALVMLTEGELLAGGEFQSVDSMPTVNVASLTTTCPAAATALGAGCTGTSGAPTLAASALPWLGSSFRSTCGPIVAGSLALALVGLTSPGTPLSQLHPAAAPGCALLASPDLTSVLLPVGGAIAYELAIPNSLSLVGVQIWHQVLEVQLGAGPQITALIGSSGLGLTIGAF